MTIDGHEEVYPLKVLIARSQINYLSHSLLALLLLFLLRKTAGAPCYGQLRIVAVGSSVYRFVKSANGTRRISSMH